MGDPYEIQGPSPLRQFAISLGVGILVAIATYLIADRVIEPDQVRAYQMRGAYKTLFFVTALAGGAGFLVAMTIYKKWADRVFRKSLEPPQARAHKLPD